MNLYYYHDSESPGQKVRRNSILWLEKSFDSMIRIRKIKCDNSFWAYTNNKPVSQVFFFSICFAWIKLSIKHFLTLHKMCSFFLIIFKTLWVYHVLWCNTTFFRNKSIFFAYKVDVLLHRSHQIFQYIHQLYDYWRNGLSIL